MERARAGETGPLWLVTAHQTAGRGRRGRAWEGPPGNLAATLLMRPAVPLASAAPLGFVAALALGQALEALAPQITLATAPDGGRAAAFGRGDRFELKWPNDVLAHGAKLSGILLESLMLGDGPYALAIGFGVNVVDHPRGTQYPATNLSELGSRVDAGTLFLALSDAWVDAERLWAGGRGLAAVRDRWMERAAGVGSPIAVDVDGRVSRGIFETIDEDCRLVIRQADGTQVHIAAGDVHFGTLATVRDARPI